MFNNDNPAKSTDQLMNNTKSLDNASLQEFMVSLKRNPEFAEGIINMTSKQAKRLYVKSKHKLAIAQLKANNKYYAGYWCTHVYVNGKRKAVLKPTEDKLYEYLFDFYNGIDDKKKTYDEAFECFIESKRDRGRSELTLREYRRYHKAQTITVHFMPLTGEILPTYTKFGVALLSLATLITALVIGRKKKLA